jgi:hypothetical protein
MNDEAKGKNVVTSVIVAEYNKDTSQTAVPCGWHHFDNWV